ncbi:Kunitz/Bovine pancreatic trypsin inhibitor domain protein [Ancylostoma caninum]|uniref:Kunitz/Bovine pancreatic trypsin inhibitor domain protein n=1 Tax=Ancylostoma caninum TaxID=29170 RepID=A0A368FYN0_ANCCA|nr:Kunitz/Bovine pancreatic trypsin inhibitor domain protein [Ancylostoma caninum]
MKSLLLLLLYAYICGSLLRGQMTYSFAGSNGQAGVSSYPFADSSGQNEVSLVYPNTQMVNNEVNDPSTNQLIITNPGQGVSRTTAFQDPSPIYIYGNQGGLRRAYKSQTIPYKTIYVVPPYGNRIPTYPQSGVTASPTNPNGETATLPADLQPLPLHHDPEIVDRCWPSTLISGPVCDTYSIRYKYNAVTKECEKFAQRDCVPSPNSFETQEECVTTCMVADLSDNSSPLS